MLSVLELHFLDSLGTVCVFTIYLLICIVHLLVLLRGSDIHSNMWFELLYCIVSPIDSLSRLYVMSLSSDMFLMRANISSLSICIVVSASV